MKNLYWAVPALLFVAACTDTGAQKDLPQENQELNSATADIYLFPDGFPNIAHKCDGTTGMWTITDRNVWIIYEDLMCDGDGTGMVLDNIPGGSPTAAVTE